MVVSTLPDAPGDIDNAAPTRHVSVSSFRPRQLISALPGAFRKLDPRHVARNPVMFVVLLGSVVTTVYAVVDPSVFTWLVCAWLWFTVLFAGLAESVAEDRGKAQAATLRQAKQGLSARLLGDSVGESSVAATGLKVGDLVVVEAGETIPGDGDVVEGIATVDESAITGESAPVVRESGGDRCAVTGGTIVLSDRIVVRITAPPGATFVDRMIALVEGSSRRKTPNEIALDILLASLTIVFVVAVVAIGPMSAFSGSEQHPVHLIALLVCLIPTTIGALLSAIGIAGMDRLVQRNVLARSGRAVEAAGDIDTLLLDKTGTITFGNRRATALHPAPGVDESEFAAAAHLASMADDTPEGRSIAALCVDRYASAPLGVTRVATVPFSAHTRMSGVDADARSIRKGASDAVAAWVSSVDGGVVDTEILTVVDRVAEAGGTPLLVAESDGSAARVLGVVELSDVVKPGIAERFSQLRAMGIRTVMVTGDNPRTAAAIAMQAGVDDVLAQATPEDKLELIRREQAGGRLVAMTGDGTNDAPALAQADVGVAMNTGTSAAKEAGNMVDLDSDPTKLIDIVEIGKQLLVTRGALTTFSLANDLAKYFAILPALFAGVYPQLSALNVMGLATPQSAILSAVVFNALVIVALTPLALRGVRFQPSTASTLLGKNLLVYGLGGVVTPFLGIWLIDLVVRLIPGIG
ncbi:potassium-transporting ATPase subunit KdpB [Rhodococcus sp. HNM0569]|uniref:potassium-transporting ATPase subunit KdpB n=1 Tax=Rhodococcus sp. HNM0569 TaxID=2716340 RepID=UPI00146F2071|nr:potassium-transporting ATPase subunit KdpB [Rhodococcus sp. HNM0569]NLU84863.1 potassium-transporting ATPase subunit KdpB [Rhodococcus sp. HNM0569]